jgi:ABC-type spermidine/putrescine transport system permease subunit II
MRRAALGLVLSAPALACSGEGAAEAIATSSLIALGAVIGSLVCAVVLVTLARRRGGKRRYQFFAVGLLALLIHPGIWMGVMSGDCGYGVRMVAPIYALLHVGLVLLSARQK